ncbi:hypothetical protein [Phaeovulum sp.]|uniref:hypothetical protein n=1 Tax=Phaeovulum sp. TaxID=2934796 RepID=UPI0035615A77
MLIRAALIVTFALGLAGCGGGQDTPARAYPALLPIEQILSVPWPERRPTSGLDARAAALAARAAELRAE